MLCVEFPVNSQVNGGVGAAGWGLQASSCCIHWIRHFRLISRSFWSMDCSVVLPREPMPSNVTVRRPSSEELEAFALEQWECFLLQLFNSSQTDRPLNISYSMMKNLKNLT